MVGLARTCAGREKVRESRKREGQDSALHASLSLHNLATQPSSPCLAVLAGTDSELLYLWLPTGPSSDSTPRPAPSVSIGVSLSPAHVSSLLLLPSWIQRLEAY
jgi:hypothetical protein